MTWLGLFYFWKLECSLRRAKNETMFSSLKRKCSRGFASSSGPSPLECMAFLERGSEKIERGLWPFGIPDSSLSLPGSFYPLFSPWGDRECPQKRSSMFFVSHSRPIYALVQSVSWALLSLLSVALKRPPDLSRPTPRHVLFPGNVPPWRSDYSCLTSVFGRGTVVPHNLHFESLLLFFG